MKILITGANGQVGSALVKSLRKNELIPVTRKDCDLNFTDQIKKIIDQSLPDLIINAAAYTDVDQAEIEREQAYKINRDTPKVIAQKANEYNIPFIHFSTDYVFDGEKVESYSEDDSTNPLGIYGHSKLAGEKVIMELGGQSYIFRTSWVYSNVRHNFYLTMKRLSKECEELKVVVDQIGVPTSSIFIAQQIQKIIPKLNKNNTGIYNLVPDGLCSWYEFSKLIISQTNQNFNLNNLHPIQSHDFLARTKRPQNSYLNNYKVKKTFMLKFDSWQKEFNKVIDEA